MPESWVVADVCFAPQEDKSEVLKQFREISLLVVEGEIFLSVIARSTSMLQYRREEYQGIRLCIHMQYHSPYRRPRRTKTT